MKCSLPLLSSLFVILAAGCGTGIHVCRTDLDDPLAARDNLFGGDGPSWPTVEALHRRGFTELTPATLEKLRAEAERNPRPEVLFACAEISYRLGRLADRKAPAAAVSWYYVSAGFAYHFLFPNNAASDTPKTPAASPFDCRFRLACELYNAAVAQCLHGAGKVHPIEPAQGVLLPLTGGEVGLPVVFRGFVWRPEEIGAAYVCSDYRPVGLEHQHRNSGLGVPLILCRAEDKPADPAHRSLFPQGLSFPATAILRFPGTVANLRDKVAAQLELIDPIGAPEIQVGGQCVPLESDLTTPIAYFMGHSPFAWTEFSSFLDADSMAAKAGVYLLEPYQPGKIPLLLVHGILSSPMSWSSLINSLRADPFVRQHYQIWVYYYPTGNHLLVTASHLRRELSTLRARLDPAGQDAALDEMISVGHSMGGIVSRLLTVDGGESFWQLTSSSPITRLPGQPEFGEGLRQAFFFERQPYLKRVVLLATPHHGSKIIESPPMWALRPFVHQPAWVEAGVEEAARAAPGFLRKDGLPSTLDLLAPGAPFLEVLAAQPRSPEVHYHTILGVAPSKPLVVAERLLAGEGPRTLGDGVVPCSSARLMGVDSERVVPAEHCEVLHNPQVHEEVKRILREHQREVSQRRRGVQQAALEPAVEEEIRTTGRVR